MLICENDIPSVTLDKTIHDISNPTFKLSTFIWTLLKKGLFTRLEMKECKTDDDTDFKKTDLNCRALDFNLT
jgi:hypothetical protein